MLTGGTSKLWSNECVSNKAKNAVTSTIPARSPAERVGLRDLEHSYAWDVCVFGNLIGGRDNQPTINMSVGFALVDEWIDGFAIVVLNAEAGTDLPRFYLNSSVGNHVEIV